MSRTPLRDALIRLELEGFVTVYPRRGVMVRSLFKDGLTALFEPTEELAESIFTADDAIEHIGLGRYGDPIDLRGHEKGIQSLADILKPGGLLYLSVPIGPERIDFNANRVFAVETILSLCSERFTLKDFSYIDDDGSLHEHVERTPEALKRQFDCQYGCGIFELMKGAVK